MIYYKVDMTNNKIQQALDAFGADFALKLPDNVLSVNVKADGSIAWVKLTEAINLGPFASAILDTAINKQEHTDKVVADVNQAGWYPPR